MKVTLHDYWMGRDKLYPLELSTEVLKNAELTVDLVNKLLTRAAQAGVSLPMGPNTKSHFSSGWRPHSVNATTKRAAVRSLHITGQAADIYDPIGALDKWLMTADGQKALTELGLWMEHPSATSSWSHVQTKPPRSGRRVFHP